jgi:hypothetical protein
MGKSWKFNAASGPHRKRIESAGLHDRYYRHAFAPRCPAETPAYAHRLPAARRAALLRLCDAPQQCENTLKTSATPTDLNYQQTLNDVALLVAHPAAMPSVAVITSGTA